MAALALHNPHPSPHLSLKGVGFNPEQRGGGLKTREKGEGRREKNHHLRNIFVGFSPERRMGGSLRHNHHHLKSPYGPTLSPSGVGD